jgi:hypothetical protein
MKGYLQRMVAGDARTERAVHPLVGGIFLKDQQQGIAEESAIVDAPRETRRIEADGVGLREVRETEAPERGVVRPLQSLADRSIRGEEAQGSRVRLREVETETVAGAEERRGDAVIAPERDTILPLQVQTLLVREDLDGEFDERGDRRFVEANLRDGRADANRVVREAAERVPAERVMRQEIQRGSEDIQIHIGRIEVIAVPSPVQRAAAGTTRKPESLEEYLRRRDRRAR